ncbi:hypothetical protein, partial [Pseudomonas umsongensis]|uniref:hypothetical protein n=1 Tax=Pseudomonas umsongensis TaxID=198618 RepID=UPI002009DC33
LKVFQNDPFLICMYTVRISIEHIDDCIQPVPAERYFVFQDDPRQSPAEIVGATDRLHQIIHFHC